MAHNTVNSILNNRELQQMQNSFCKSLGIYIYCVNPNGDIITSFAGSTAEEDFIAGKFSAEARGELLSYFVDGINENVVEGNNTVPYILTRAVAMRSRKNELVAAWIVVGVAEDLISEEMYFPENLRKTTSAAFDSAIELIESVTNSYMSALYAKEELGRQLVYVSEDKEEMSHRLLKSEVMTEILKYMEADATFSEVAESILGETARYLDINQASLIQLSKDGETVDMVTEYFSDARYSQMANYTAVPKSSIPFMTGRPYTISSDTTIPENFSKFFSQYDIKAGVFLPLDISGRESMYLCFLVNENERKWSVEDLKFINDVKRIISTVLVKRITKNSLASSYSALEAILEHAGCGVSVNDIKTKESLYTNETFNNMFTDAEDAKSLEDILYDSDESFPGITGYLAKNAAKYYDITFSMINWVDGRRVRLSTFYDITDIRNYQRRIERQANEDSLTGLFNRKKCERDLEENIAYASINHGKTAMCIIDLDDFNNINDGLGHQHGDMLLRAIGYALDSIPTISGHVYRVGGDEFAILIDSDNYKNIDNIVARVTRLFDKPWKLGANEYFCTMSMGVVSMPKDGMDVTVIFQRADIALREAKLKGKNRVEYYNTQEDDSAKKLDLEKRMRQAVADGCKEFEVYYQPLINVGQPGNPCCGAEALVRWNNPELGFVYPSDFIPLAEYLGLIIPIGEYVLNEACKKCKYWNDFGHPNYKVNVNLSVVQLLQNNIVEVVGDAIEFSGINPCNLTLEVTESLAINDLNRMKSVLSAIRAMGCRVALDDFGTGYSSLNHIRSLPIDTIKIDQCFVRDIDADEFSSTFVKTVSELADTLNMDVCVEGVEQSRQEEMMHNYRVNLIQGYYYDKPLPGDEFDKKYVLGE